MLIFLLDIGFVIYQCMNENVCAHCNNLTAKITEKHSNTLQHLETMCCI